MAELYQLAYISKNVIAGALDVVEVQIRDILSVAQLNNKSKNITGALLFSGGYFCQVIEGEQAALEALFESIQMDARHADITVLHFQSVPERCFSDWSMAFAGIEEGMRFDIDGIKASKDDLVLEKTGADLVNLLAHLVAQRQQVS